MSDSGQETTVEDLLAEITAREATARVLLRQDLIEQHRELLRDLEAALAEDDRENREPVAPDIAQKLVELEAELDVARRVFRFRAIGRRAWLDLLAKFPPTKKQKAEDPRLDHNPDTFPAEAIAASCVAPKMTVEQVLQFEAMIDLTEWNKLWVGCLDANTGGDTNPKSVLAGRIRRASAALGITPVPTESPAVSSLEG